MRTGLTILFSLVVLLAGAGAVGGISVKVWPPARERYDDLIVWWSDGAPPRVEIGLPSSPVSQTVHLRITAADRSPTKIVGLTLDGRDLPAGPDVAIDTRRLADGPHQVVATAEDQSRLHNRGSARGTLTVDNTPPSLGSILVPASVEQGHTAFLGLATDAPPGHVRATIGRSTADLLADGKTAWLVSGIAPDAETGPLPVTFEATDSIGNVITATRTLTVTSHNFPSEEIDVTPEIAALLTDQVVQSENAAFLQLTSRVRPEQLWTDLFVPPVRAPLSSVFGTRRQYNVTAPGPHHGGTDYAAAFGSPVVAAADGIVVLADRQKVRGNVIVIDHGLGVFTAYFHLSQRVVDLGDRVTAGERIGLVGSTGLSTGPHLHWEMRIRGVAVDAREWTERTFPEPIVDAARRARQPGG